MQAHPALSLCRWYALESSWLLQKGTVAPIHAKHASTVTVLLFVEVLHFFFLPKLNNELLLHLLSTGDIVLLCIADMQALIFTDEL